MGSNKLWAIVSFLMTLGAWSVFVWELWSASNVFLAATLIVALFSFLVFFYFTMKYSQEG